ncbi:S24 family peptidase [Acinetobacter pittii]|uniref:S24 family peptidase n=1 Tax=Acinetobacter pittii TaxID=48296 RepID=UPI00053BEF7C|nr:S24 family peptidase [Acinetobacter pittii]MDR0067237.1 S24 family peptidase [Acinetobacter sp. 11520]MDU6100501.1 S24 family peptidase [Acinetobacter sp.]KQG01700.1 alkaline phosphatase [Acinetobacter pittii]MBM0876631.1 S24 family peptidase [Acinetobacter pittii]MCU4617857.1 S24 family peptidase [Acinetobacter pittii]
MIAMSTMVERIQDSLKKKKLSWSKAATSIGLSPQAPAKWKKGQIGKETLDKLAALLEVDAGWLLNGGNPTKINHLNIDEFMAKHGLNKKENASFDTEDILEPDVVQFEIANGYIWVDVVEANFSCGTGESIEFHFDVINGKYPFPPSFFQKKQVDPSCFRLIKAKGDSMEEYIYNDDLVGIDISQTNIIDGEIYAVYFEGEGMIKKIFKEQGGTLILHSLNEKYRDRTVTEQNGVNFKVMGRQVWRAG